MSNSEKKTRISGLRIKREETDFMCSWYFDNFEIRNEKNLGLKMQADHADSRLDFTHYNHYIGFMNRYCNDGESLSTMPYYLKCATEVRNKSRLKDIEEANNPKPEPEIDEPEIDDKSFREEYLILLEKMDILFKKMDRKIKRLEQK